MNHFAVHIDDSQFTALMERVVAGMQKNPVAMRKVANQFYQFVIGTFRQQTDPWGHPWPVWADATRAARRAKKDYRVQKLIDSDKLFDSIHAEYTDTSATVFAGAGIEYAEAQQFGTRGAGRGHSTTIPPRAFFPMHTPQDVAFPDVWLTQVFLPIIQAMDEIAQS